MTTEQTNKKKLGRGLNALFGEASLEMGAESTTDSQDESPEINMLEEGEGGDLSSRKILNLPLSQIIQGSTQPRKQFSSDELNELAESIKKIGLIQPIIVRRSVQSPHQYELVAGERRWRASQIAELEHIPAIIKELDEKQALQIAIIENIQREDLNPLDEAEAYKRLIDEFSFTQLQIAEELGKSRSHIANLLRLNDLEESVKELVRHNLISLGHAKVLVGTEEQQNLADLVVKNNLSVRQLEKLVKGEDLATLGLEPEVKDVSSHGTQNQGRDPEILQLEKDLSTKIGFKVKIKHKGKKGDFIVHFNNAEELSQIIMLVSQK